MPKKQIVLYKMTELEQRQVEENLNLVHYLLHKNTWIKNEYYEDYFQNGVVGLCLAVQRFDESKGCQFATFATAYIEGYIKRHHRDFAQGPVKPTRSSFTDNSHPNYLYLDGLINERGDNYGYDLIEDVKNTENDIVEDLEFQRFNNSLSKKAQIIIALSLNNVSQEKIGQTLGVSQPQISRIKVKLRKKIESYYLIKKG